ncbi:helix-turn-helix domain-containing protein [Segeticoccus rhizosphaerae]|jgi:DNA-binding transcriptional ArsR family regulator|uniref:helix-turn-helix domain-containing protein n=1 Tax=Segeticoccus rhizosphaerae TaxID=1104777 RepID=UPI0012650C76|nr:helix-turn-helix domain-containing protein [Segeticoccus rhizosphaerae]
MPSAHRSRVPSPPLDRAALRVLAHPLRSRLLAQLRVHGRATATELAQALSTHTGATSYHLRRLEEVGLVSDSGTGAGRRRVWEAGVAQRPATMAGSDEPDESPADKDEDEAAAAQWLARDYVAHFGEKAQQWVGSAADWPEPWREVCGLDDHLVLVTAEQLTALQAELLEVLERYRRVGQGTPGAKRVSVYTCALPVDPPSGTTPGRASGPGGDRR